MAKIWEVLYCRREDCSIRQEAIAVIANFIMHSSALAPPPFTREGILSCNLLLNLNYLKAVLKIDVSLVVNM